MSVTNIHNNIGNLTKLKALGLGINNIVEVPETVGNLSKLNILNLTENKLTSLPHSMAKLQNIEKVQLFDNPFETIPEELFPWLVKHGNGGSEKISQIVGKYGQNQLSVQKYILWAVILLLAIAVFFVFYVNKFNQKEKKSRNKITKQKEQLEQILNNNNTLVEELTKKNQELETLTEELRQQSDTVTAQRNDLQEKTHELEALAEELRQQSDTVTAQRDELQKKTQKLEELQETKDLMISAVNHDLRNPLNPILNYSSPNYPNQNKKNLRAMIHERAKNMLSLINDIMDVYRSESLKIEPVPASPYQASEQAIQVIAEAQLKKPLIVNQVPKDIQAVFEFKYIERVLENFLSNAVKYTKPEAQGGKVSIWASQEENFVRLGITDNGMGIPKDKLQEIFLPFTNPNAKSIGGAKSVGIGLTFCKTIIEAHQSKIDVTSEEGVGTSFSFLLPLAPNEHKANTQDILENIQDLIFSASDKEVLQDIVSKIKEVSLRDSKLRKLLKEIPVNNDENIARWQKALQQARQERKQAVFDRILEKASLDS